MKLRNNMFKAGGIIVIIFLIFTLISNIVVADDTNETLTVYTSQDVYGYEDQVGIYGQLNDGAEPLSNSMVGIEVDFPNGDVAMFETAITGSDGYFCMNYIIEPLEQFYDLDYNVFVAYLDERANTSFKVNNTPSLDVGDPEIFNVNAEEVTTNTAKITWTTNKLSNSKVEYGSTTSYGMEIENDEYVLEHTVYLTNLISSKTYHFKVISKDFFDRENESEDYTFTTKQKSNPSPPGSGGPPASVPPASNSNAAPKADAGGPYFVFINKALSFDGSGSNDSDGDSISFSWDLGDGSTSKENNPTYVYDTIGIYNAKLTVDDGSKTDEDNFNVYVFKKVQDEILNIGNTDYYLVTTDSNFKNLYLYNLLENEIIDVNYERANVQSINRDNQNDTTKVEVNIINTGWTYFFIEDKFELYNASFLTLKNNLGSYVTSERIWREKGYIYVLDNSSDEYLFNYHYEAVSPLFDLTVKLTKDSVKKGESLEALIDFINVGLEGEVSSSVTYNILKDNEILYAKSEEVSISSQKTISKTINTNELSAGEYTYFVSMIYGDNQKANTSVIFNIEPVGEMGIDSLSLAAIISIIIFVILVIFLFIRKKRKEEVYYYKALEREKNEMKKEEKSDSSKKNLDSNKKNDLDSIRNRVDSLNRFRK